MTTHTTRWFETLNLAASQDLKLHTPKAEGRDKAMNTDNIAKVNHVILKLETLSNLFEFYWFAQEKTGFNKDSIDGLCFIIKDCIHDLKEAVEQAPVIRR